MKKKVKCISDIIIVKEENIRSSGICHDYEIFVKSGQYYYLDTESIWSDEHGIWYGMIYSLEENNNYKELAELKLSHFTTDLPLPVNKQ